MRLNLGVESAPALFRHVFRHRGRARPVIDEAPLHEAVVPGCGAKIAVTRAVNKIARQRNKLRAEDANLGGESIREGLTAVVAVLLPNPEWAGPIRTKLANSEARGIVDSIVSEVLSEYFADRPDVADAIVERAIKVSDEALIRRKEKDLLRRKSQKNDLHPS